MKPSKPSSVRFRKIALSVAVLLGFACGPSFDPNEFMSFFQPESATMLPSDRGFVFSPQLYADNEWGVSYEDTLVIDENVRAWASYAGGKLSDTEVSKALYKEEPGAVTKLTSILETSKTPAVSYLKFAWSADDGQASPWATDAAPIDSAQLPQLLEEAKAAYKTTSDAFLKERYAFQAVKLACERADYKQASQLYDRLVKPLPKKTFISDWALCRRAGATLALGDTSRAIYEFAQVFDRCPSRRRAAETSLRKYGITFRDEALQYAKTDGERAAVYALCAIQPGQDALELLKALVHLAPKNPLVELIMAREINRNEYYFFMDGPEYMHSTYSSEPDSLGFVGRRAESVSYFDKLRAFALESAENKALGDGAFWYTATAYLDYIGKDYKEAQTHLDQATQLPTSNPNLKKQIALQRMLLLAAQTSVMTPDVEHQLIGYLEEFDTTQSFRLNNAFVATCKQFAAIYQQKVETKQGWFASCTRSKTPDVDGSSQAKAYLLTMLTTKGNGDFSSIADPIAIEDSVPSTTVRQTLAYASQASLTDFDKRLLKLSGLTSDYLNLLLGRRLMMEHHYAEATDVFTKVDPKTWKNDAFTTFFTNNPFAIKMPRLQGKGVNFPAESEENPYTPVTFARRMAELEQQAKSASGDKAAELYYLLGCGAWNMSWYGNAWLVTKSFWSGGEPPVYDTPTDPTQKQKRFDELMHTDYYTTTTARTYFEKSAKSAKTPALADRSAYMAARCEANAFSLQKSIEQVRNGYVYEEDSTFVKNMLALRKTKYAQYYKDFFNNHTNSPFNQEMIRECAMYKDFLSFGEDLEK
ncbi:MULTISPECIES: hypothetical protein [unclassified Spirosoma]|uniref:tetratricopeptide repeat protein n=1 Tax=unclassified Spirosoma TaxID=2621999 RepID=UPI001ACB3B85|nr:MULTISPECIES: hypothetical protein [unclassified Spirosoma]MBN8821551.1 hypothetical protein [Spirosoma sp.]